MFKSHSSSSLIVTWSLFSFSLTPKIRLNTINSEPNFTKACKQNSTYMRSSSCDSRRHNFTILHLSRIFPILNEIWFKTSPNKSIWLALCPKLLLTDSKLFRSFLVSVVKIGVWFSASFFVWHLMLSLIYCFMRGKAFLNDLISGLNDFQCAIDLFH